MTERHAYMALACSQRRWCAVDKADAFFLFFLAPSKRKCMWSGSRLAQVVHARCMWACKFCSYKKS